LSVKNLLPLQFAFRDGIFGRLSGGLNKIMENVSPDWLSKTKDFWCF